MTKQTNQQDVRPVLPVNDFYLTAKLPQGTLHRVAGELYEAAERPIQLQNQKDCPGDRQCS